MKKLILLLLVTGCASTPPVVPPVLLPTVDKVEIPKELLIKCAPLQLLDNRTYTGEDTVKAFDAIVKQSEECRARDSILVDTIIHAFNIESSK